MITITEYGTSFRIRDTFIEIRDHPDEKFVSIISERPERLHRREEFLNVVHMNYTDLGDVVHVLAMIHRRPDNDVRNEYVKSLESKIAQQKSRIKEFENVVDNVVAKTNCNKRLVDTLAVGLSNLLSTTKDDIDYGEIGGRHNW